MQPLYEEDNNQIFHGIKVEDDYMLIYSRYKGMIVHKDIEVKACQYV